MMQLRPATIDDYMPIISVVDAWWERPMAAMLPRLFFEFFASTSLIAEEGGKRIGFLVGFLPPAPSTHAYIHFVGVNPDHRQAGGGRELYEAFFDLARSEPDKGLLCHVTGQPAFHRLSPRHGVRSETVADDD